MDWFLGYLSDHLIWLVALLGLEGVYLMYRSHVRGMGVADGRRRDVQDAGRDASASAAAAASLPRLLTSIRSLRGGRLQRGVVLRRGLTGSSTAFPRRSLPASIRDRRATKF